MSHRYRFFCHCCLFVLALVIAPTSYAQVLLAVASNFYLPAQKLAKAFERQSKMDVSLATGSSGKHYAQIIHGAPFDVFLSADSVRPDLLLGSGKAKQVAPYALGRLVLVANRKSPVALETLSDYSFKFLAIANPKLAPYGLAAQQSLASNGFWPLKSGQLVQGENITQAWQFVRSGAADLGLVAWSLWLALEDKQAYVHQLVDPEYHQPIVQKGALLSDKPEAVAFWRFLFTPEAGKIIQQSGYEIPRN